MSAETAEAIAYELRQEYAGTITQFETEEAKEAGQGTEVPVFTGGIIHVGDAGETLDVREELDKGNGRIVLAADSDTRLVARLDDFPALRRVAAGDATPTVGKYEERTAADLRDELERRGIVGASKVTKPDLVAALERLDEVPADDGTHISNVLETAEDDDDTDGEDAGDNANGEEA